MSKKFTISFNGKGKFADSPTAKIQGSGPTPKPLPNPTAEMLNGDPLFDAIWAVIKDWDINTPEYYNGYMSGTGSHVTLIYDAIMKIGK